MSEPRDEYNAGETEELRPCPFCGSQNIINRDNFAGQNLTGCDKCGSRTYYKLGSLEAAKQVWNTRPLEDALRSQLSTVRRYFSVSSDDAWQAILSHAGEAQVAPEIVELREANRIYRARMDEINGFAKNYMNETPEAQKYAWMIVEQNSRPLPTPPEAQP